ncbi:MAG: hypothetical protein ACREMW_06945 [Gemmatimonadales bacterium]
MTPLTRIAAVAVVLAAAHEKGILKLVDRRLVPGTEVRIAGEKFGPRAGLALTMEGLAGRVALGTGTADSAGTFTASLHVPADLALGDYRLVARATDGDEVAGLDVEIITEAVPTATSDAHAGHAPSAEPPSRAPGASG